MSRDSVLVPADWAEKNLDTPGVVFVEVDEDTTAYDNGHIPGAIKLDWKQDLQDPVRRDFVNKQQFEALLSARGIGTQNLVDVRSPDEYAGRLLAPAHLPQEQAQRAGHIPTAISVPWSKAANEDGTFKSDDELRDLYGAAGLDEGRDTIAYCRIGERSSHTWFALHELLGQANVKNYDGSWTEYGSLVGVPVALGDEPGEG